MSQGMLTLDATTKPYGNKRRKIALSREWQLSIVLMCTRSPGEMSKSAPYATVAFQPWQTHALAPQKDAFAVRPVFQLFFQLFANYMLAPAMEAVICDNGVKHRFKRDRAIQVVEDAG